MIDSVDTERAVEQSITVAKALGARIVLMYVTQQRFIPKEYVDYAKTERIQDYHSTYFGSLAENSTAKLRERIEEEDVECTSHVYVGSLSDAMRACQRSTRVLMLVIPLPRKSLRGMFVMGGFKVSMLSDLRVPVILVPV